MRTEGSKEIQKKRPLVWRKVGLSLVLSDVVAMGIAFMLALMTAPMLKDMIAPNIYARPLEDYQHLHDLFFLWLCPFVVFMFFIRGHYTNRVPWWNQVRQVLYICFVALIIDGFMRLALDMSFSRILIALSWLYLFLFVLLGRQIVYQICRKMGLWNISTVVVGDIETVINTLCAFRNDPYTGYDVVAIYLRDSKDKEFNINMLHARYAHILVEREFRTYGDLFHEKNDHFFVIALESFRGAERDDIVGALSAANALYAIVPPISRTNSYEMEPQLFFGHDIMLLHSRNALFTPWGRFIKRSMDIAVSGLALFCLLPIILFVALFLKIEGQGGSLFYGGYRIGKNGYRFKCWKFRSMEPESDHLLDELFVRDPEAKTQWELYHKLKVDPRVTTRTAAIIRKTSIDELPQLWNVLVGDMSLVGPRPILEDEEELFGDAINQYMRVRPGITGLWQVSGRNDVSFQRRVYWDSWYVRNWSVWGDIVIMIKTLRVVLARSGAY